MVKWAARVDAVEAGGEVALHGDLEGADIGALRDDRVRVGVFGPVARDP
jgi:hypothetical protein